MGREIAPFRVFSPEAEEQVQLAHKVILLCDKVLHLELALEHSRDIGVAMGMVMAQEKVTRQCAFDMLRMVSQHQNRKLYAVAFEVIETGTLPLAEEPSA